MTRQIGFRCIEEFDNISETNFLYAYTLFWYILYLLLFFKLEWIFICMTKNVTSVLRTGFCKNYSYTYILLSYL